jgi:hypothetical protein
MRWQPSEAAKSDFARCHQHFSITNNETRLTGQTGIFKASYKREEKGAVANETRNYWNS